MTIKIEINAYYYDKDAEKVFNIYKNIKEDVNAFLGAKAGARKFIDNAGKHIMEIIEGKLLATWAGAKPEFHYEVQESGDTITLSLFLDNEHSKGGLKYKFLDDGTAVRHALMSMDFSPKTSYRSLRSKPGRGQVIAVSNKIVRPGIEAREFSEAMADDLEDYIVKRLDNFITEVLK